MKLKQKVKEIMKKITVLLIFLTACLLPNASLAQEPNGSLAQEPNDSFFKKYMFGVGVIAGQPTGLTAKYNLDPKLSIDGGLGWVTSSDNKFHIYGSCIYHVYDLIQVPEGKLPLYFGGGLRFINRENKDNKFGVRMPIGAEYQFKNLPVGAFIELVPVLNLTPDTDFDLDGGIGIRYFF